VAHIDGGMSLADAERLAYMEITGQGNQVEAGGGHRLSACIWLADRR